MMPIRVALVEDHTIVRQGLIKLIAAQPDMRLVKALASGREALEQLLDLEFHVLLLDLSLPDVHGTEVLRRLRMAAPLVQIVILSMYPRNHYAAQMRELGAAAYVSKNASEDELLRAIRNAASGRAAGAWNAEPTAIEEARPHFSFTARELQVFTLLVEGTAPAEIATRLDLSKSTVSNHLAKVREKLGVQTIAEIVRYALEERIIGPNAH